MDKIKVKTYTLKAGMEHNGFDEDGARKVFVGGDSVPLTDSQFNSFKDKFETAEIAAAREEITNTVLEQALEIEDLKAKLAELEAKQAPVLEPSTTNNPKLVTQPAVTTTTTAPTTTTKP